MIPIQVDAMQRCLPHEKVPELHPAVKAAVVLTMEKSPLCIGFWLSAVDPAGILHNAFYNALCEVSTPPALLRRMRSRGGEVPMVVIERAAEQFDDTRPGAEPLFVVERRLFRIKRRQVGAVADWG